MTDSLFQTVSTFFSDEAWPFTQVEGQPILRLHFEGENGRWLCLSRTSDEHGQFMFYSVCPMLASEERRMAAAEFITRINYGLVLGNFEMDFTDGEIRFKTSLDVGPDAPLDVRTLRQLVYLNVLMMDKFFPAFAKLLYNEVSPIEAFSELHFD